MNRFSTPFLIIFLMLASMPTTTQADDVAAERAQLANQRIQAEEERRAREEAERLERAKAEAETQARAAAARETQRETTLEAAESSEEDEASAAPAGRIEMSRALEQLRELGALRDAGYLTEEEFEHLKKKILDGAL
ncbi:MAG: SHOCT domain-containing protein [Gammaproteobacteria bacterium]|nr:SHOCT domain-containing protein [Gammaproteobacteria bacterium]